MKTELTLTEASNWRWYLLPKILQLKEIFSMWMARVPKKSLSVRKEILLIGYFSICQMAAPPFAQTPSEHDRFFLRVLLGRLADRLTPIFSLVGHGRTKLFSFSWLGLKLTLPSFVVGGPSKGVAGFSPKNRSPIIVASGADSSSDDLQSSSSSGEVFPFEIWYRDNSEDDTSEDPFSWVESDVKRAFSQYIQGSLLLGTAKKLLQAGPWTVRLRHCRPNESVNSQPSPDEAPFFFIYEPVFSKLGLKLPFTAFKRSVLRAFNVAPSQLHSNSWAFVRAFELLCEDLGRAPSLGVFFWFFRVKKTPKVGWMSLSSRPNRKLLKPFLESFKTFKDKFFKVCPGKSGPSLMADQSGTPYFPLY
ncbi:hypothetical protein CR513_30698, partial [Mucuna pruriens]